MPSGDDPMAEYRFSLSQQTLTRVCAEILLKQQAGAMAIHPEAVALWRDYLDYRDLISRQRAARSPVKASRCSSIGQALPR
jgi:hypothetical protein